MKSLGETLKLNLRNGLTQVDIALGWLEYFEKKGKTWSLDHVETHLGWCLDDNPKGTRFFFDELERAMVLLELFGVPKEDRMDLFELADDIILSGGKPTTRIVIDATRLSLVRGPADLLFSALKKQFIEQHLLSPGVIVITEDQSKGMPKGFAENTAFRIEKVISIDDAVQTVVKLAGSQALIVAGRKCDPFERWIAARFDGQKIAMEPADGIEQFVRHGTLPSLPALTHSLADLVGNKPLPQVRLPGNPLELRKLMVNLRTEDGAEHLKLAADVRLACARLLEIDVTSTQRERVDSQLGDLSRNLKIEVRFATRSELESLLTEAASRFVPPCALQVDGVVHLINPTPETRKIAPPSAKIHVVTSKPPAIIRFLEEISDWTENDFAEDQGLKHAIVRLDPEGTDRLALLHIRAGMIWSGAFKPATPRLLEDWRTHFETLIHGDPPPAELRLRGWHNREKYKGWTQPSLFLALDSSLRDGLPKDVVRLLDQLSPDATRLLTVLPALTTITVDRKASLTVNSFHKKWYGEFFAGLAYKDLPSILFPEDPRQMIDARLWVALFEGSRAFHPDARPEWIAPQGANFNLLKGLEYWQTLPFAVPPETWRAADRELAFIWLALRQAMARKEAVQLHDKTILLPLGSGIFAEIKLSRSGMKGALTRDQNRTRASLEVTCELAFSGAPEGALLDLRSPVITHMATTASKDGSALTELGYSLPSRIHLNGGGMHADITFLASPFFLGQGGSSAAIAVAAPGAVEMLAGLKREEARAKLDVVTFEDD